MRFFAHDDFDLPLPDGHRFPGHKYGLLHRALIDYGIVPASAILPSPRAERDVVLSSHSAAYVEGLGDGSIDPKIMRRVGFPWSPQIPRRGERTVGGALAAARSALADGLSGQLAGGTHHAHRDFGAGFCIYNDFAAVALTLLREGAVKRIAIIDLDVHQGDGNAALLNHRDDIYTVDVFGEKNFPFRKVPSTHDVPLPDHADDALFLKACEENIGAAFDFGPDLILYQAGVDPLVTDRLGRLDVSFDGLMERDRMVLRECWRRGIPCSMAIGGGYSDPIDDTVEAYANTYRVAKSVYRF